MANYESVTRSNYFHVKDEDAFSKFMDTVSGDDMHCWSDKDEDGIRYMPLDAMEVFMEFRTELKIMILTFFFPNFRSTLLPKMRSSLWNPDMKSFDM